MEGKRSRYYHSQIDMELLLSGSGYEKLPNTYVIMTRLVRKNTVIRLNQSAEKMTVFRLMMEV